MNSSVMPKLDIKLMSKSFLEKIWTEMSKAKR